MSAAQARNRQVIARFLEGLLHDQGWWYRVPKLIYNPQKSTDFDPDDVMPHLLGTLFGLTEDATSMVLVAMGLSERKKGTTTFTHPQGWDDLASEFEQQ
jgi:hypothetical protein